MKNVEAVEIYNSLNSMLITGLSFKGQCSILKNLRLIKPLAERYKEAIREAHEKLKPEGFDELERKAALHNEALRNGDKEGMLNSEEVMAINKMFEDLNRTLTTYVNELNEEESLIEMETISMEDFEKLLAANDKETEAGKLALLNELLCN